MIWRSILFIGGKAIISRNAYNVESWWYLVYPLATVLVGGAYAGSLSYFHNWWDNALTLRSDVLAVDRVSEEFRSFPSGHATSAFVTLATLGYLPRFHSSWLNKQSTFFFIVLLWALLSAFSRLLIGAHFLSDVSFGALITTTCFLLVNFAIYHKSLANTQVKAAKSAHLSIHFEDYFRHFCQSVLLFDDYFKYPLRN